MSPQSADRVLISWRHDLEWSRFAYPDEDSGHVEPEDVLWWLLRQGASLDRMRCALDCGLPDFDVDAEVDHVAMPDRAHRRAQGNRYRLAARTDHVRKRRGS